MDIITIVYIIIAVLIGAAITYFVVTKNNSRSNRTTQANPSSSQEEKIVHDYEQLLLEAETKAKNLKAEYDALVSEIEKKSVGSDNHLQQTADRNISESTQNQIAEVDKLKKEIKRLKEEIEDNEDDIEDYKKKIKKKDDDNLKIHEDLVNEQQNNQQLNKELERVKSDLDDKNERLTLNKESLDFVQEILSAKKTNDNSIEELYRNVDSIVDYVNGELKDTIKSLKLETKIVDYNLQRWAIAAKKSWIQGKTSIAFVGEFSSGKTSIVNRILSQDNPDIPLLPVSAKATTAIPTYISGGVKTKNQLVSLDNTVYQFVSPDNTLKKIEEKTFKRINKEVLDQVKGISSLIQYFVMKYENDNLENLSILDTPGFNSTDKEDAERTIGVINECDALFWVFDVNAGTINRSSIDLIKKHLKKPLYIVINKVDTKPETEINRVKQYISEELQKENILIQDFIQFSTKEKLEILMNIIRLIPHDNEQESFLRDLLQNIKDISKKMELEIKSLNSKRINLSTELEILEEEYKDTMSGLKAVCVEVAAIPQLKEHFFSKDRYEMSKEEYVKLENYLNLICETCSEDLIEWYEELKKVRDQLKESTSNYMEKKEGWNEFKKCEEQLKKLFRKYESIKDKKI